MRWLRKGRIRFLRGQRGISLIETLVAVAILGVVGVVFAGSMDTAYESVAILDEKTQAEALARSQLEQIKDAPYPENHYAQGTGVYPVTVNLPPQYSMVINVMRPTCIGEADDCTPIEELFPGTGTNIVYIQQITVSIFRTGSEGDRPVFSVSCYKSKVE